MAFISSPASAGRPSGDAARRVLIVDDEPVTLSALARILRGAGHEVATFTDARALLAADFWRAGCAVIDLHLPGMNGLDVKAALTAMGAPLPVVLIASDPDARTAVRAMKDGAVDFLIRPFTDEELLDAVARALAFEAEAQRARAERRALSERLGSLSLRERGVCERVGRGMLNKEIAADLGISEATVKVHRGRGMKKLGAASALALADLMGRAPG